MQPEDHKSPINCTPDYCIKPDATDSAEFLKIELNKEAIEAFTATNNNKPASDSKDEKVE